MVSIFLGVGDWTKIAATPWLRMPSFTSPEFAWEPILFIMARPVTKYAVRVDDPQQTLFELQKALYIAAHGRRGPVWVDVPLDVQSAMYYSNNVAIKLNYM